MIRDQKGYWFEALGKPSSDCVKVQTRDKGERPGARPETGPDLNAGARKRSAVTDAAARIGRVKGCRIWRFYMFTIRNALRNIGRAKGRSILIGIIITIIALAVCIGLCIRQSAADAKETALSQKRITATISPDREQAMKEVRSSSGSFDRSKLKDVMGSSLSLTQLKKYAKADSVQSFYYTLSTSVDASGSLQAYSSSGSDSDSSSGSSGSSSGSADSSKKSADSSSGSDKESAQMPGGGKGFGGMNSGDFTITGYSSDESMTDFVSGTSKITSGKMFAENTSDMVCVISSELAKYNNLKVGSKITVANPNKTSEKYTLKIVGIYKNSQSSAQAESGGPGQRIDPANNIYTSYSALNKIVSASKKKNTDSSTRLSGQLNGTYVLGTVTKYNNFKKEVKSLGLSDKYTVSSQDIEQYEQSAQPLNNLAKFAGYFLLVILILGAVILVVMNIFSTRERKYEIGVLTAIGMKKKQVAKLFVAEIMALTLAGVVIGGAIGAVSATPVTKALLSSQISQQQSQTKDRQGYFGRDNNGGGPGGGQQPGGQPGGTAPDSSASSDSVSADTVSVKTAGAASAKQAETSDASDNSGTAAAVTVKNRNSSKSSSAAANGPRSTQYITNVSNSLNIMVLLELLGSCLLLGVIAGAVSVIAIMRYEPLQILNNRD